MHPTVLTRKTIRKGLTRVEWLDYCRVGITTVLAVRWAPAATPTLVLTSRE